MATHDIGRMGLYLGIAAIAGTALLGISLRLEDPLSTPVIPAEDPYTHMALVRDHVGDGKIEPLYEGSTMYPPGMHVVLASYWSFTGTDLYDLFRVGPAILGGIGIVGIAILVARHAGLTAGVVSGLALALAPEHIFRTTMMAPTALDLAVLPFLIYALIELLRGRFAWLAAVVPMLGFLVFAHPWLVAILGPAALVLVLVGLLIPWRQGQAMVAAGGAAVLGSLGAALAVAVTFCMDQCGLSFQDVALRGSAGLDRLAMTIAAACAAGAALLLGLRRHVAAFQARLPLHWSLRAAASVLAAAFIIGLLIPAVQAGMPEFVDLPRMFGWPILVLAGVGLVLLPWHSSPAGHAGAALAAVTYPFVLHNPFDSEFWPHRTAVFLGLGLAILAGHAAIAIVRVAVMGALALGRRLPRRTAARPIMAGAILSLVATLSLAGTVYAATPDTYEGGWYRLYPECEFEAMRAVVEDADEDTVIITASWQGKLVLAAFAKDPQNVWYMWEILEDQDRRENTIKGLHLEGRSAIVLIDRHMMIERPYLPDEALHEDPWRPIGAWCTSAVPDPRVKAFIAEVQA